MRLFGMGKKGLVASVAALLLVGTIGLATAATTSSPTNGVSRGRGIPEFGLTKANFAGKTVSFTYTKGFFCDTSITAASSTGCEVGKKWNHAPAASFDPLYIVVPLGAATPPAMSMECPSGLVCVDHPGTLDLTRIEPALKPLYPSLTNAQLTAALKNFATPGHQHYITDLNNGKAEWWDVRVVGVTSKTEYNAIVAHHSASYLLQQVAAHKTTAVIPTNLFLFFAV